jgi:hypothetical protein
MGTTHHLKTLLSGGASRRLGVNLRPLGCQCCESWFIRLGNHYLKQRYPDPQFALNDLLGGDAMPNGGTFLLFQSTNVPRVIGDWIKT